ncbi:GNAT family N-acetyltransferase [Falsigemmobacter faecalis]|uniref:GNAT family N-acetyltransferase n=1 Tax=Falsigemmobacter faecalis TaxID=2488730 RepID=UPI00131564F9|nr:GNAT family N-acetyltransferase [Falsigemmobacter faecalis]
MQWREMREEDLAGVLSLADRVHPDLPESYDAIAEKRRLYPAGCHVLEGGAGSAILGYAISHPIRENAPPALDSFLGDIPPDARQFYIHDLVLDPQLRGGGHARHVIDRLLRGAADFSSAGLVSVYGTAAFWARFGFAPASGVPPEKLAVYGADAVWMRRERPAAG